MLPIKWRKNMKCLCDSHYTNSIYNLNISTCLN
uniref:Uncharacterized protein n=1 Tax=Anguilla anguilla TaxID=7936 RepID=A0A0E9PDV2_ANGAN